jgi:hypothetical protein
VSAARNGVDRIHVIASHGTPRDITHLDHCVPLKETTRTNWRGSRFCQCRVFVN